MTNRPDRRAKIVKPPLTLATGQKMPMFRKKPLLVEAMQFTQETKDQVFHFVCCNKYADFDELGNPTLVVQTLAGVMTVKIGDWMIKTHKNEFYPCTEENFDSLYDPVQR